VLFEPFQIKGVQFANRILRFSMGGRTAYYDGTVSPAWRHFEKKFAKTGVAGIISATIDLDDKRLSPLEYPKLSDDRLISPLRAGVKEVQQLGCRYIIHLGDPGGQTQTSLFSQKADAKAASANFDLMYDYRNRTIRMTTGEVEREVEEFAQAARHVRDIGADGLEITASKGYIIHQFLNPVTNRRRDRYGGSLDKRFQLLREIVTGVRQIIGSDFLFGIRFSAEDHDYTPINLRLPIVTENALSAGECDMIALARPLLANPNLLKIFASGQNDPAIHPPFAINAAAGRQCCRSDAMSGVPSQDEIERQIVDWSGTPDHGDSAVSA
jgi:2,4-dienoyl-CoA reductase (NADPH2)